MLTVTTRLHQSNGTNFYRHNFPKRNHANRSVLNIFDRCVKACFQIKTLVGLTILNLKTFFLAMRFNKRKSIFLRATSFFRQEQAFLLFRNKSRRVIIRQLVCVSRNSIFIFQYKFHSCESKGFLIFGSLFPVHLLHPFFLSSIVLSTS